MSILENLSESVKKTQNLVSENKVVCVWLEYSGCSTTNMILYLGREGRLIFACWDRSKTHQCKRSVNFTELWMKLPV